MYLVQRYCLPVDRGILLDEVEPYILRIGHHWRICPTKEMTQQIRGDEIAYWKAFCGYHLHPKILQTSQAQRERS